MERKVGEEFFSGFYGTSFEVRESKTNNPCAECDFRSPGLNCIGVLEETGDCASLYRSDGKSVIFKKVWQKK